jgi:hypothetical protein
MRLIDSKQNEKEAVIVKGVVCMDLALAIMNITGTHIHSYPGDAYFWFFNGIVISIAAHFKKSPQEGTCL